jgi:hypothetical protein
MRTERFGLIRVIRIPQSVAAVAKSSVAAGAKKLMNPPAVCGRSSGDSASLHA